MKKVIVGSTSGHKIGAVHAVVRHLDRFVEVIGVETRSGQNAQPVGFAETILGARTRALEARKLYPDCMCIGIESGLLRCPALAASIDFAVVAVITPRGAWSYATTPGLQFLEDFVEEAEEAGFKTTTAGSIHANHLGGDPTDPHATLTQGSISRVGTLIEGIKLALAHPLD